MRGLLLSVFLVLSVPGWAEDTKAGWPGHCAIGGEAIADLDPVTHRMELRPNYRLLNCTYTNGQTARMAVCDQHRYHQPSSVYPIIWESIKRGWQHDIEQSQWPMAQREAYWKFYEGVTIQTCDE